jgi:hypothetical protein
MERRLRFSDLRDLGIVKNRVTLRNWIVQHGFPRGQLTGPNCRTWGEQEVEAYLDARPVGPKPDMPVPRRRPGRPRKNERSDTAAS